MCDFLRVQIMLTRSTRFLWRRTNFIAFSNLHQPPFPGDPLDLTRHTYVDKTMMMAKILSTETPTFLNAPSMRRTGKTITISMMEHMARGNVEMFDGMDVNDPASPFQIGEQKFSVIKLDFSGVAEKHASPETVKTRFVGRLEREAYKQHGLDISGSKVFVHVYVCVCSRVSQGGAVGAQSV